MRVLATLPSGHMVVLDEEIDVNAIAHGGDLPGELMINRFRDRGHIDEVLSWDYKTEWEIRELDEMDLIYRYILLYPDIDDDYSWEERQEQAEYEEDFMDRFYGDIND
jgi:hypothetical protein